MLTADVLMTSSHSKGNLNGMLVGEGAGARGGGAAASRALPAAGGAGRGGGQRQPQPAAPPQNSFTPAPVMLTFVPHVDVDGWHVTDEGTRVVVDGAGSGHLAFVGIHATKGLPRCGVTLDSPNGKNNGTINGAVYFQCPPGHGLLTAPKKVKREADVLNETMAALGVDSATATALIAQKHGAAAPPATAATTPQPAAAPSVSPAAAPVFCKNCGHSLLGSGLLFCTECGMRT